jgi:hypothetical protein
VSPIAGGESFDAYRTTKVAVHESQADVRELLRNRRATGLSISESWLEEQPVADVRFAIPADGGGFYAYRLRVRVPEPAEQRKNVNQFKTRPLTAGEQREARALVERQVWRLVFWWLKAQFEAADAGLVALEEALLPWMELADGSTVYESAQASGGLARIAAGTSALLGTGR